MPQRRHAVAVQARRGSMLLAKALDRLIHQGSLEVIDPAGRRHMAGGRAPGPHAIARVHDRRTAWRLLLNPRLAVGEGYMDGTLTVEDSSLYDLLDVLCLNMGIIETTPLVRASYRLQRITRNLE